MRTFPAALALALTLAAAATAFAAEQRNAYAMIEAADAAACARACEDDSLCMAWTYHADSQCGLSATSPGQTAGVPMGFATRAPAFLRASAEIRERTAAPPAQTPAPQAPTLIEAAAEALRPEETPDDPAFALLGGPLSDTSPLQNR